MFAAFPALHYVQVAIAIKDCSSTTCVLFIHFYQSSNTTAWLHSSRNEVVVVLTKNLQKCTVKKPALKEE